MHSWRSPRTLLSRYQLFAFSLSLFGGAADCRRHESARPVAQCESPARLPASGSTGSGEDKRAAATAMSDKTLPPANAPDSRESACPQLVAKADAAIFPCGFKPQKQRCFPFRDVTFALFPGSYYQQGYETDAWRTITWELVRIEKNSSVQSIKKGVEPNERARWDSKTPELLKDEIGAGSDSYETNIVHVSDLDGDALPEIILEVELHAHEAPAAKKLEIWTVKDDDLVDYKHEVDLPTVEEPDKPLLEDVDKDGRLDIRTVGPYADVKKFICGGGIDVQFVPLVFVLHALSDGTFASADLIAKKELKRYCPSRPNIRALFGGKSAPKSASLPAESALVQGVVCARAWGATEKAVLEELVPGCHALPASDCSPEPASPPSCPEWLLNLTKVSPPVHLE